MQQEITTIPSAQRAIHNQRQITGENQHMAKTTPLHTKQSAVVQQIKTPLTLQGQKWTDLPNLTTTYQRQLSRPKIAESAHPFALNPVHSLRSNMVDVPHMSLKSTSFIEIKKWLDPPHPKVLNPAHSQRSNTVDVPHMSLKSLLFIEVKSDWIQISQKT